MRTLKNGKAEGRDKIMGEMIKGGGDQEGDWIRGLCNMAFERCCARRLEVCQQVGCVDQILTLKQMSEKA